MDDKKKVRVLLRRINKMKQELEQMEEELLQVLRRENNGGEIARPLMLVESIADIALRTGIDGSHLERMAEKYELPVNVMSQLACLMIDFNARPFTVVKFMREGYSLEEIYDLYTARNSINRDIGPVSLRQLANLHQTFLDVSLRPEHLVEVIDRINRSIKSQFTNMSVNNLVRLAREFNALYVDVALEFALGLSFENDYDEESWP